MKTALVTGAAGFIGRNMCERLQRDGWETHGLDTKWALDCRDMFQRGNQRFDLVVHCAAVVGGRATIDREPMKVATDLAIDSDFFQWVLRIRPQRAVYFSSSAAYPIHWQNPDMWASSALMAAQRNHGHVPLDEAMISLDNVQQPDAIYGWVKLTGERLAQHANAMGANIQVYRPFSGYGADQDLDYPFPSFIQRAKIRQDPFPVWGKLDSTRDWIHVDNIVELVMRGLDLPPDVGPINLCTGKATSMDRLADICASAAGYSLDSAVEVPNTPMGVMHRVGSPTKMYKHLGPVDLIPIEEGVERAMRGE